MMKLLLILPLVLSLLSFRTLGGTIEGHLSKNPWVLLVAGSRGWEDYDFEANVCHAYHLMRSHGVPEDRIIVMMYDDKAYAPENPTPGVLINWPNGRNVYEGCKIDYRREDVTPEMFLDVLSGNETLAEQGRKVIQSTKDDNVFVYLTDHGTPHGFGFPNSILWDVQLKKTVDQMYEERRYGKLVIFMSACFSGSMFKDYEKDRNVMVFTGANPDEYAWRCFYDKERDVYLSDQWSSTWKREIDSHRDLKGFAFETLFQNSLDTLSKFPKNESSTPSKYGDQSLLKLPISQFMGSKVADKSDNIPSPVEDEEDMVRQDDAPLVIAQRKMEKEKDPIKRAQLEQKYSDIVEGRQFVIQSMEGLAEELMKELKLDNDLQEMRFATTNRDCFYQLVETFNQNCFNIPDHYYVRTQLHILVNTCEGIKMTQNVEQQQLAKNVIRQFCEEHVKGHRFTRIV